MRKPTGEEGREEKKKGGKRVSDKMGVGLV